MLDNAISSWVRKIGIGWNREQRLMNSSRSATGNEAVVDQVADG
jgi:hypothetical protein